MANGLHQVASSLGFGSLFREVVEPGNCRLLGQCCETGGGHECGVRGQGEKTRIEEAAQSVPRGP